ncbi:hypothetical protein FOA52_014484 [Chlamydomonas sp. UWO 241]|nr:hypothetical protein FOA52_014484 [Chlamydomonas sp. UWO 241]
MGVPDREASADVGAAGGVRKLPQVIVVTGPTAVGKTAVGLELAKRLGGEVISADSVQVYRTLDIGSDKLPLEQRQGIPHHLIDVRDHTEEYSAGDFSDEARAAVADILSRGRMPIVVGGTGFYLRWLTHGKAQGPRTTPEAAAHVSAALKTAWADAAVRLGCPPEKLTPEAKWDSGCALLTAWGDAEAAARTPCGTDLDELIDERRSWRPSMHAGHWSRWLPVEAGYHHGFSGGDRRGNTE